MSFARIATTFAVALGLALAAGACVDRTVTHPPREVDLTVEEIRTKLQTGSFRDKLEARKQIAKLEDGERFRVLQALSEDPAASTRTIAVGELGKMLPHAGALARLTEMAAEDPDETVRELAAESAR